MSFHFMASKESKKLEELYKRYGDLMFRIARSILKDDFAAEDAVHKAFERLICHIHKIGDVSSRKTAGFLVIIVKNISLTMYNEDKKRKTLAEDEIGELTGVEPSVQEVILSKENYARIIEAVKELPSIYGDAFLLKYSHGYKNTEIADVLQINEANVRKRLQVARQKLAERLTREEDRDGSK